MLNWLLFTEVKIQYKREYDLHTQIIEERVYKQQQQQQED